ncbi:hypothetical protein GCM10011376_38710 [Nocardioides flavus (ex Wang et al. 2016)]|uniref:Uncharacterized protein n=1 Tax=Nocardioides flavus (ex Wang et al. 2016) TaxID=2058780 RepID=A0ABQ3HRG3_9ACTN|nr:hypothetical protein [Nocardioides flavus (ex Wang et al. 2016)]GHE19261.1 hypothetical protein GCM10011376_38710 [Nocardioides flavus (ex Wang et al. 2016)]
MDLSALIFVALAVAWAVYLIPKALKHHDEVVRSRSVEKFSHTMRVLARREPVDRRNARLVVSPIRASLRPPVETKAHATPAPLAGPVEETVSASVTTTVTREVTAPAARTPRPLTPASRPAAERASARRAAKRRRTVLALVVLANAVVIGLAAASVITWPWVAAPAGVLVAWLVACRVSVRAERRRRATRAAIEIGLPPLEEEQADDLTGELPVTPPQPRVPAAPVAPEPSQSTPAADAPAVVTGEIPVVGGWDMVPTTLPTYVNKPAAQRRTVSTIDLDSTGVWSSGRNDEDSALARSVEQSARAAREAEQDEHGTRRASGA